MAKRLTDKQRKAIIADYVELGSYNAVGKRHCVADTTVKRIVVSDSEMQKKAEHKKEQNTADILAHMDSKKDDVNRVIDRYLAALLDEERIAKASPAQLTTAMGTLIDKFTAVKPMSGENAAEDDPLTKALMEEAERMNHGDLT